MKRKERERECEEEREEEEDGEVRDNELGIFSLLFLNVNILSDHCKFPSISPSFDM